MISNPLPHEGVPPQFLPHGFCLGWDSTMLTLEIVTNVAIGLAYWVIPLQLLYYRFKYFKPISASPVSIWVPVIFAILVFFSGSGRFLKVVTLFYPIYWVVVYYDLITMIMAILAAIFFGVVLFKTMNAIKQVKD